MYDSGLVWQIEFWFNILMNAWNIVLYEIFGFESMCGGYGVCVEMRLLGCDLLHDMLRLWQVYVGSQM